MLVVLVQVQVLVLVLLVQERMLFLCFSWSHSIAAVWFWCMRATHPAGMGMDRSTRPRRAA